MSIEIPEDKLQAAIESRDGHRLLEEMLCALWSKGELSGGVAAEVLGITRETFWQLAGSRGYTWPYFLEDFEQDIATLKSLRQL